MDQQQQQFTAEDFKVAASNASAGFDSAAFTFGDEKDAGEVTVAIVVPERSVAWLIGKGGSNINEVKALVAGNISFSKKDTSYQGSRMGSVSGALANVAKAIYIMSSLSEMHQGSNSIGVVVANQAAGAVIGKGGSVLKSLRETTECKVGLQKREEANPMFAGRVLTVSHDTSVVNVAQAVYTVIRLEGFASPSKSDTVAAASMGGAPDFGQFGGFDSSGLDMFAAAGLPGYGAGAGVNADPSMCSVHGKRRGKQNLQASTTVWGAYECRPEDPCKGASNNMFGGSMGYGAAPSVGRNHRFSPYGGGANDPNVCAVHGKRRGTRNLQPSTTVIGAFECRPDDQCKGSRGGAPGGPSFGAGASNVMCATHGKRRGERNLQPHPSTTGLFVCLDSDPCK